MMLAIECKPLSLHSLLVNASSSSLGYVMSAGKACERIRSKKHMYFAIAAPYFILAVLIVSSLAIGGAVINMLMR